ncbi:MAG: CBS domain-containing protein [Solobacterium sp.]|nr:CBS domain-containing protein [Solobacterium sp.]
MSTNAERFLNAYAGIEKEMNRINGSEKYIGFAELLGICAKKNAVIKSNYEELRQFNTLRNAIVHQRDNKQEIMAIPTDAVVEMIEMIEELLVRRSALNYSQYPVRYKTADVTVNEAFTFMADNNVAKLPVYDENGFRGVITMTEIARWFSNGKSGELPVELLVQQGAREEVYFMPKETEIQEVLDIFADNLWEKKISPLILITETGSKRETPVGIISIYDIARILETLI